MQLRSGRRLVYPLPAQQGGRHRHCTRHSSEDRISNLPKDLLLEVLARLESPIEAARAGAVCRGWRSLWTELPELRFWCAKPLFVESVLARITRPSLNLLDITLWGEWFDEEWAGQVSLLLCSAERLLPEKLTISVLKCPLTYYNVELPCFERTSCLSLDLFGSLPITLPQSGEFTVLESLYLKSCCIDLGALLPLCPCLRILNVDDLKSDMVIVHSLSLEEFGLKVTNYDIGHIEIAAPVLKEVILEVDVAKDFSLSFRAPMVKKLRWGYSYPCVPVGFGQIWHLMGIMERELDGFHAVSLRISSADMQYGLLDAEWGIAQVIAHLPVTVFCVLELDLKIDGHAFGSMMLHLLRIQPSIQRLKMVLARDKVRGSCPVNCPCEQNSTWRSENISLDNLEVVEIHGVQGEDDEVDVLKIILRCATMLRRLTMCISRDVSPNNNGYEKFHSIMKEYPDVEFGCERVIYP